MPRPLRWILGLLLAAVLVLAGVLLLPFHSWLPGGTLAELPRSEVVNGTAFNRLFPEAGPGEQLVFTQEKRGFSEAKLRQGDQTRALLAISDTITLPEAREKFAASEERIEGWPLVEQGSQASALLVAGRFQVKVLGQGVGMDPPQRHDLLAAFHLRELAALAPSGNTRRAALPGGTQQPLSAPGIRSAAGRAEPSAMEPAA